MPATQACLFASCLVLYTRCPICLHPPFQSREVREKVEMDRHRAEQPKIQQQFVDLKRGLSAVADDEWKSIPEVGNLTRKKRRRQERSFVVHDSVLVGDRGKVEYKNALYARQQEVGGDETETNFLDIGQAGKKILSLKLDQVRLACASFSNPSPQLLTPVLFTNTNAYAQISGTTTALNSGLSSSVDPKGYFTSFNSVITKPDAEIGDIKYARMLFDSCQVEPEAWALVDNSGISGGARGAHGRSVEDD